MGSGESGTVVPRARLSGVDSGSMGHLTEDAEDARAGGVDVGSIDVDDSPKGNAGDLRGGDGGDGSAVAGHSGDTETQELEAEDSVGEGGARHESECSEARPAERPDEDRPAEEVVEARQGDVVVEGRNGGVDGVDGDAMQERAEVDEEELGEVPEVGWTGWVQAVFDRDPEDNMDLAFVTGQALEMLTVNGDGWSVARTVQGATGMVPSAYVRKLREEMQPGRASSASASHRQPSVKDLLPGETDPAVDTSSSNRDSLAGSEMEDAGEGGEGGGGQRGRVLGKQRGAPPDPPPRESRRRVLPAVS
ncbi:hypothetical protein T484DRAFT_1777273 [Baffinella frigidus]|nr:hypothetical protein T484DRAFT_1777273 [Cryptophyta sp. CCMP2293]